MKLIKCDHCNRVIKQGDLRELTQTTDRADDRMVFDLCSSCYDTFVQWLWNEGKLTPAHHEPVPDIRPIAAPPELPSGDCPIVEEKTQKRCWIVGPHTVHMFQKPEPVPVPVGPLGSLPGTGPR
jgi:hypothetical protein